MATLYKDERPEEMIKQADPEVIMRDYIKNYGAKYGITADQISWYRNDKTKQANGLNNGMVTIGGQDFMAPDRLENGRSFTTDEKIRSAIDQYAQSRGLTDKTNPQSFGYDDKYSQAIDDLFQSVVNAPKFTKLDDYPKFSYDPNTDKSFQAMRQVYGEQGDRALANTMSEASSLTGGRLNSWAVSAGQGAKADFDSKLMSLLPQYEQNAYGRYIDDYGRVVDEYERGQDEIANKLTVLGSMVGYDSEMYRRAAEKMGFAYDMQRDKVQDNKDKRLFDQNQDEIDWRREFDSKVHDDNLSIDQGRLAIDRQQEARLGSDTSKETTKSAALDEVHKQLVNAKDPNAWFEANKGNLTKDQYAYAVEYLATINEERPAPMGEALATIQRIYNGNGDVGKWIADNGWMFTDEQIKALTEHWLKLREIKVKETKDDGGLK